MEDYQIMDLTKVKAVNPEIAFTTVTEPADNEVNNYGHDYITDLGLTLSRADELQKEIKAKAQELNSSGRASISDMIALSSHFARDPRELALISFLMGQAFILNN